MSTPDWCLTAHCSEDLKIAVTAAYCMSHVKLFLPEEIIKSEMRPSSGLRIRRLEHVCDGSGLSFAFLANQKQNATSSQQLQRRGRHAIPRRVCCKRLRVNSTHINQFSQLFTGFSLALRYCSDCVPEDSCVLHLRRRAGGTSE